MKVNFGWAALVAFAVAFTNVPAFAGLFDGCLYNRNAEPISEGASFFDDQAITFGEMNDSFASNYAFCEADGFYGECASCAGASETVVDGGVPAAISYDAFPTYGYSTGYTTYSAPRREGCLSRLCKRVKGIFRGRCKLCRPAYVCDPCWSFCDPCYVPVCSTVCDPCFTSVSSTICDPCWTPCAPACDPCSVVGFNAGTVFAPQPCCGAGYYPGEVNELDPTTGKAVVDGGIDAQTPNNSAKAVQNSMLSTEPEQPAVPALRQDNNLQVPSYEQNDDSELETVPTPQANPNLGAGVLRMLVPEDSVVYVNGYRTKQKGELRTFAANNLEVGESYTFEVRVVALRDGEIYEDVQSATLTAGSNAALAFNLTLKDNQAYAMGR